ncbi:MAG TPA: topoisomerase DNA-binding C4 zinc finger domain-containing protein [archaeon]|nr:topoisomerase DNA-binding C4 zinc finger domain-containing protein [archaeon]
MNCIVCGKTAVKFTREGLPCCSRHSNSSVKKPMCPECGIEMTLREGKFGKFWGCKAFPMCDGMRKI